ncbi:PH domain-containing protein [Brevibacterium epidermidis]|uniref:PH domain-containing protein n=1 Tax=Brevibacterium epidermidis TaxID=1698 RepID=UPI000BF72F3D|nr:PH domain-containing protein [Brevibacterium epidermidis]
MTSELQAMAAWTFTSECPIPDDLGDILVPGETPVTAFKTIRDSAVFTNKRLIIRDAQGIRGKKIEMYSIPYSTINMWSSENSGTFDFNEELELWTRAGHLKIKVAKGLDIRKLDRLIAQVVIG